MILFFFWGDQPHSKENIVDVKKNLVVVKPKDARSQHILETCVFFLKNNHFGNFLPIVTGIFAENYDNSRHSKV